MAKLILLNFLCLGTEIYPQIFEMIIQTTLFKGIKYFFYRVKDCKLENKID